MLIKHLANRSFPNPLRMALFRLSGVKIGKGSYIDRFVKLGKNVKIGKNVRIYRGVKLHDCVIEDNVAVGEFSEIRYARIGSGSNIGKRSDIYGIEKKWAEIGCNVSVGNEWILDGTGGLKIEDLVTMGSPAGSIYTHSNLKGRILGLEYGDKKHIERKPVSIGTCVWIGGKVTIQHGVDLGHHCAILANSIVKDSIEPNSLVSGCPAKVIKKININEGIHFKPNVE